MAKKKPCEFCETDNWNSVDGCTETGHQLSIEFYPGKFIGITSFANNEAGESEELSFSIGFDYCPYCGRKLDF